jgi:pimeloyl-ACP methyl ester carboxylesterase
MPTRHVQRNGGRIAFDDTGGDGAPIVMLPGAGDVRSEYRFITPHLIDAGRRVVTMDLRGHGESSAGWPSYQMADTADDLIALIEHLDAGPAFVVATSFAPAAALWAASERPDLFEGIVLISAHLEAAPAWQATALRLALRGPLAPRLWGQQYRSWHPGRPPTDLDEHVATLVTMMNDPQRRRAARETLTAHRDGLEERIGRVDLPCLVIMGGSDSHFSDPAAEAASIGEYTGGTVLVVPNAGHYPHVEFPDQVAPAIADFLAIVRR